MWIVFLNLLVLFSFSASNLSRLIFSSFFITYYSPNDTNLIIGFFFVRLNGIEFEEVNIDLAKGQHRTPEYQGSFVQSYILKLKLEILEFEVLSVKVPKSVLS